MADSVIGALPNTLGGGYDRSEAISTVAAVTGSRRGRPVRENDRMSRTVGTLVLLRHGESEWNAKNLFTGWVDVDLTAQGEAEARRGGEQLREHDLLPDVVHTSVLRRAIRTAELALNAADRHWIPVRRSWRLNERHYGALQGKNKKQTLEAYGEEQFMLWRRSYDVPPPPIADDDEFSQIGDPRYADLPDELKPRTECLKDVLAPGPAVLVRRDRARTCSTAQTVLVAAHGNSLRAIVKHLDADLGRGDRGAEHPDRHAAAVRPRPGHAAPAGRRAGSTSTRPRRPRRRRRWPTRGADRAGSRCAGWATAG